MDQVAVVTPKQFNYKVGIINEQTGENYITYVSVLNKDKTNAGLVGLYTVIAEDGSSCFQSPFVIDKVKMVDTIPADWIAERKYGYKVVVFNNTEDTEHTVQIRLKNNVTMNKDTSTALEIIAIHQLAANLGFSWLSFYVKYVAY